MTLRFSAKVPGPSIHMDGVAMKSNYREAGWRVVQPVLDAWAGERARALPVYPAESSGPAEADALLERDRRHWRALEAP